MFKEFEKRLISSIILILMTLFVVLEGNIIFYIFLIIGFLISSYEWLKMIKRTDIKILGILFLFFSFYSAFYFRDQNLEGFLLIIIICVSTDIGGYIFGNLFKGPKLTKISPNKTYSGTFGGFILAVVASLIYSYYINTAPWSHFPAKFLELTKNYEIIFLIFVLIISLTSQIGDLIISYFKRLAKIKDTGKIIPGHGGLLDRIDGLIFAIPISYLFIIL